MNVSSAQSTLSASIASIVMVLFAVRLRRQTQIVRAKRRTVLPNNCVFDPTRQMTNLDHVTVSDNARTANTEVLFFEDVRRSDSWLVGGKGANLGELVHAGLPVPNGFCITKLSFDIHMRDVGRSQQTLLSQIEGDADLSAAAARAMVCAAPMTEGTVQAIRAAYQKLCKQEGEDNLLVAVRSSATAEDSSEASFAGQLDTFLGISGEAQLIEAVKNCWASLYSDRVDAYRRMVGKGRGTKECSISVCVVVQRMLDADCAGVMFTANPFSHALNETVITANWGLGESVVADIATPDTWVVSLDEQTHAWKVLSSDIAVKLKKVILARKQTPNYNSTGSSEIVDIVSDVEKTSPCLQPDQIVELAGLGRRIQVHYGNHPQDTEWGLKNGKVYLLQARPITTLSDEPPRTIDEFDAPCRPEDWITTCNAAEMFPGPMTPLTMSTFGRMADQGVQRMQIMFGCRDHIDLVNRVTANYSGNFFLNMSNTLAPMCAGMIGGQMAKDNGEMSILGSLNTGESLERLVQIAGGRKPLPVRMLNGMRYMKTMVSARHRIPVMLKRIDECAVRFEDAFSQIPSAAAIWHEIDSMMDAYDDQWTDGIVTSSTSAAFMLFAMKLLTERGGNVWDTQPVAELAVLLGDETADGTAESTGPVEAVDRLRDLIIAHDDQGRESANAFASATPEEALAWLRSKAELRIQFASLLERHGHRCVKEAEMREKDWFEDSLPLVRMLQSSVRAMVLRPNAAASGKEPVAKNQQGSETVIMSKRHLNPATRAILRLMVKVTRKSVHLRELGKSLQVKLNAVFKHAYRKLGIVAAQEGRLPEPDLLYFLTHEEIGIMACVRLDDPDLHRLKTRATQRRRLLVRQAQLRFPELSQGIPKPMVRTVGKEGSVGEVFQGTPVSAGITRGIARVARTLEDAEHLKEGEILITPQTDVGWTPFFSIASGLVTEIGGMLSHGAVVAREYSLPCVVGVNNACEVIKTGTVVELDGDCGRLTVISTQ